MYPLLQQKIPLLPGCPPECRACRHRQFTQEESLNQKAAFLATKLHPWSNLIAPVRSLNGTARWGYRNKTTLGVQFVQEQWQWGLWRRDELLHIPHCPVHRREINLIINALMASLPPFDFGLRWLVMSGKQLTMVVKSKELSLTTWPDTKLIDQLKQLGLQGLWLHLNPSTGKRIFGKGGWKLLWGQEVSTDESGLLYGPAAFSQLIPELYDQALNEAFAFLNPDQSSAMIDLYSGSGSSIKRWSDAGAQVIGVEAVPEAVNLARRNVPEVGVLTGTCTQRLPQLQAWCETQTKTGKSLLLYANPPRTGIEAEVLHWIAWQLKPLRIAYLSCSPGTLSRNLEHLTERGYSVKNLIPFDFFPQTHHIETLALIERSF